ncbi:MAG: hypothetical protein R6V32_04125 [Bacteroidales bacterium]
MKRLVILTIMIAGLAFMSQPVLSQDETKEGYFIAFDNVSDIFVEEEGLMIIDKFYLQNFPDGKSSKFLHKRINDIETVEKFGIASNSERFSNQRRCYIKLPADNYADVLKHVLITIPVEYILVDGNKLSVEEFIEKIKSIK